MKKVAYFVLMLVTWYLAGMYRSRPLMALCAAELTLLVLLFALSRYFRAKLSARFPKRSESAEAGRETVCRITVVNGGRLPVGRTALRLRVGYQNDRKSTRRRLYGSGERGESDWDVQFRFPYCGLARVRLDALRAFDYLTLFSVSKALSEEMTVAVFPGDQALVFNGLAFSQRESRLSGEQTVSRPGDGQHEIRQLREYRVGDPSRHIHWNQSAKMDELWIREYEKENDATAKIFADLTGSAGAPQAALSAFYTLLSALIMGLLKETAAVRAYWQTEQGLTCKSVRGAVECRDLLLTLYQTDFTDAGADYPDTQTAPLPAYDFRLTVSLALFAGDTLLYQFSPNELEQEIKEKVFTI